MRIGAAILAIAAISCSAPEERTAPAAANPKPQDSQHAGITTPHGDHSPHHGGMVLMQGELHYEVVLDPKGKHSVWFSDAVREELPASVASTVAMTIERPDAPAETVVLAIDDSGESWIANGRSLTGKDVMVKLMFTARGEAHEIEIPYITPQ
jgi:hypothetical protein